MNHRKSLRPSRRAADASDSGLLPPADLWGKTLPLRPLYDAALPFEERIARAWEHLKATRFTFEEHERLRELLVKLIEAERNPYSVGGEHERGMSNGEKEGTEA